MPLLIVLCLTGAPASPAAAPDLTGEPSAEARRDIPHDYLRWYQAAARTTPGLGWNVLAAIGKVESDHGRSRAPGVRSGENSAGAGGPMQFLAATWAAYGVDADHDGRANRYSAPDAIYGAGRYLAANGATQGGRHLRRAIWQYNHADWYVRKVLDQAARYATSAVLAPAVGGRGIIAARAALHWLGTPYSWGGGTAAGPTYGVAQGAHTRGFDCSGLVQYAWAKAGIHLHRVAADQYNDGPHVPRAALQPGDLLFFAHNPNDPATIHHVGLYLGNNRMVHAPQTGDVVRVTRLAGEREHEYAGATRPTNPHPA
ncbi:NlpC/P60 family protein [Actinomadura rayongensis]|uniref:NlpC/P60 family protein n=1 Tax=Actinomadura rayongensis TaxID=1429076 RepID=UPI001925459E